MATISQSAWCLGAPLSRRWTSLLIGLVPLLYLVFRYRRRRVRRSRTEDAESTDPALLRKYTTYHAYDVKVTGYRYPRIRTVYHAHAQAEKLPTVPTSLPLLVFVHGLGGSAAQLAPLTTSLVNVGPCLLVDLPGCGLSEFAPLDWGAYTTHSLAHLLDVIIESYRDKDHKQGIVLLAHSMGCSLSALLASGATNSGLSQHVLGLVAMCPRASNMTPAQAEATRRITRIPAFLFDLLRLWDRRGGIDSQSVRRGAGTNADAETRKLQLRYNTQSRTPVWRRTTRGLLPAQGSDTGLPKLETWKKLTCPIFLIAGEDDLICPPAEIHTLAASLREAWYDHSESALSDDAISRSAEAENDTITQVKRRVLKTHVFHSPASHALPYSPTTVRTLSGLIQNFLTAHVDPRLSLGWQLTYLSDSGKWDVKNLLKWQKTVSTSTPIGQRVGLSDQAVFLAIKTMREVDEVHTPKKFARDCAGQIKAVVDISHESPVYDPKGLEDGGIEYHKFPSVSKLPPSDDEVTGFEDLIDGLRGQAAATPSTNLSEHADTNKLIAVHCHYGFNRTGYFIVCYLIDRMDWKLEDAVEHFGRCRPPGIKHSYFIDALYVRYCGDEET